MKRSIRLLPSTLLILISESISAQLSFTVYLQGSSTITCANDSIHLTAFSSYTGSVNYHWTTTSATLTGSNVYVIHPGIYTVTASSGSLISTQTITINGNTTVPVSTGPTSFVVSGTAAPSAYTFVAISPTVNFTHYVYSPTGGTITANTSTMIYYPGTPGNYWHCLVDNVNGCATCIGPGLYYVSPATLAGVKVYSEVSNLVVWPNPAKGQLNITSVENDRLVELLSVSGIVVRTVFLKGGATSFEISELSAGIYMLRVTGTDGVLLYSRIVIE